MADTVPSIFSRASASASASVGIAEPPLSSLLKPIPDEPTDFITSHPPHLPTPPFIHVHGVPNFRDLGGYACWPAFSAKPSNNHSFPHDNGLASEAQPQYMVRPGLLYRCGHPTQCSTEGGVVLRDKLGVKDVYDLRSAPEIKRLASSMQAVAQSQSGGGGGIASAIQSSNEIWNQYEQQERQQVPETAVSMPNGVINVDGVTPHFVPVYEEQNYQAENLAIKIAWYTAPIDTPLPSEAAQPVEQLLRSLGLPSTNPSSILYSKGFISAYRDILAHGVSSYTTMFCHILTRPSEPLVFHCTAGKDRTGVFAALVLRLAGVPDSTIIWEYSITEPGLGDWRDVFVHKISRAGMLGGGASVKREHHKASVSVGKDGKGERPKYSWDVASRICGSRGTNMAAFLNLVLDGEEGGAEMYLKHKCGFGDDEIVQIKKNIVAKLSSIDNVLKPEKIRIRGWDLTSGMEDDVLRIKMEKQIEREMAMARNMGASDMMVDDGGDGTAAHVDDHKQPSLPLYESAGREAEKEVMTG